MAAYKYPPTPKTVEDVRVLLVDRIKRLSGTYKFLATKDPDDTKPDPTQVLRNSEAITEVGAMIHEAQTMLEWITGELPDEAYKSFDGHSDSEGTARPRRAKLRKGS